jgi:Zn-dependent membrane protease YugP
MIFDPFWFLFAIPGLLLGLWATVRVKSAFARYSRVPNAWGATGWQVAEAILRAEGIQDVTIERGRGLLSDNYDPRRRVLRLSPDVHDGASVAAVGVAAHEVGHAVQDARGYFPLQIRSGLVPLVQLGSHLYWILLLGGLLLHSAGLALLGLVAFGLVVLFQLVTLPVEFDASARAKRALQASGASPEMMAGVSRVLNAAALTYVAAAVTAILQLLYWLWVLGLLGGGDGE